MPMWCRHKSEHVTLLVDLLNVPLEKLNYKEGGGGPDELIARSDAARYELTLLNYFFDLVQSVYCGIDRL